ncbi:MAG: UDP-2,4-diacetamido-2,4,6-trideoxy-beta-L-altropyranose hydrolase [Lewinella sp.]
MGKPVVIFRADGSFQTGVGHLVRSSALAEMLSADFDCWLLYRECPKPLLPDLEKSFSAVEPLRGSEAISEEPSILIDRLGNGQATIVLDGYQFDTAYQNGLLAAGYRVVCIDDIHRYAFTAELVINHAPSAGLAGYDLSATTAFAFGPRFALLRKPFRDLATTGNENKSTAGVFVCLGGADPGNATLQILRRLEELRVESPISVVIGPAYRYAEQLEAFAEHSRLRLTIFRNLGPEDMARLMAACPVGITSPSTVSMEYLSSGGTLYLRLIAENQRDIYRSLIHNGQALEFDQFDAELKVSPEDSGVPVIDGRQSDRYRALFRNLGMSYRTAETADSDLYFKWANDPQVRAQSFSSGRISLTEHQQWFKGKLSDPATVQLLFQNADEPVGQVRVTLQASAAVIGYSVASGGRGKGAGLAMLLHTENYLQRYHPEIRMLRGYVKRSNPASILTFRRLGYQEMTTTDYPDAVKFEFDEL